MTIDEIMKTIQSATNQSIQDIDKALIYKMINIYGIECEKRGMKEAFATWTTKSNR